jgi:hypothetical protein
VSTRDARARKEEATESSRRELEQWPLPCLLGRMCHGPANRAAVNVSTVLHPDVHSRVVPVLRGGVEDVVLEWSWAWLVDDVMVR